MKPHEERVVEEKKELDIKIEKLRKFMIPEDSLRISHYHYGLLQDQEHYMQEYSEVLRKRIEDFNQLQVNLLP